MIADIFASLDQHFQPQALQKPQSYYFSIDDQKKTVLLSPEGCRVEEGKTLENADCVCKTSAEFFLKVWNDCYQPSLSDFLTGRIKSNNPDMLKLFLRAFSK
ncbi:hypothetical protein Selin_1392 [Desulfurispirillum indicum S5]|uniref:SCP2 domain-containing protein n=1 Tax=Desulfurispirillum indicum (strain ATCC BAA-1389 / DSM 22839 / S5) TaxID=653733 RepID=E6W691_DESIS|nr:hypothetical protein [Desulfurispirillum indicum]ADU66127.1 hypothetical protein Selin_1392 [Desulfurispirillum indicum S5]